MTFDEAYIDTRPMVTRHVKLAMLKAGFHLRNPADTFDELTAAADRGVWDAFQRFDASRGIPFRGFAYLRVSGSILEYLRGIDTLTRHHRREVKTGNADAPLRVGVGFLTEADDGVDYQAQAQARIAVQRLLEALPDRWRYVIVEHDLKGRLFREIALDLGVNESRAVQIRAAAIAAMRRRAIQ